MNILIIGSGGREHALGWKLKQSPKVKKIFFAPGNAGTAQLGENINIKAYEIDKLLSFAIENEIGLTVVGPDDPLALGIVDLFENKNQIIFGPNKLAARLESSKAWATNFMDKYGIPQPIHHTFKNYENALTFINLHDMTHFVIKASGLALGKGVTLPSTQKEAIKALERIMIQKEFGEAGQEIVVQERLIGREVSIMALSDGKTIHPFVSAQDHKRIYDNDKGPNTGGMGAYAPVPFITKKLLRQIHNSILQPTIDGMRKEKCLYKGVLYAGLMITKNGPKVLEYNARFGDPETQPVMMLLKSDILPLLLSCIKGNLKDNKMSFYQKTSVCIVLASHGYPGNYDKGVSIQGLPERQRRDVCIFHAGTAMKEEVVITNGGRVLGVTAIGKNIKYALQKAYNCIGKNGVYFKGMQYRTDIGRKAINTINKK